MKDEFMGKCVPPFYFVDLLDKWRRITQGNSYAKEYVTEFDEFLTSYNIWGIQIDIQIFFQFRAGLRVALENELWNREITELKKAYVVIQRFRCFQVGLYV